MVFNNGQYLYQRTPQFFDSGNQSVPRRGAAATPANMSIRPMPATGAKPTTTTRTTSRAKSRSRSSGATARINNHGFFSHIGCSAQRLPNGNTFICSDTEGHFFEVTAEGELVWEYINPVTRDFGTVKVLPDALPMVNSAFRAFRFAPDHPAFKNRDLKPLGTITDAFAQPPRPKRPPGDNDPNRGGNRRGGGWDGQRGGGGGDSDNRPSRDDQRGN